ncbi:galactokinase [bacterium]|nr:galactokinase [bacterium]
MTDIHKLDSIFRQIYADDKHVVNYQMQRYESLMEKYKDIFDGEALHFFSTPGRTEIGGNHTDHNHGRVLAASINLDSVAVAAPNNSDLIVLVSERYEEPFTVELNQLNVVKSEKETTKALIRGIAARLKQLGYRIGGFHACMTSDVLPGSGLSSSASVEILIATIFNALFNEGKIPPETLAALCQYAENVYFGKPCGLMDQMTCAVGGMITIDFKDPARPVVRKVSADFNKLDFSMLVVNTGTNHADLTHDYAAIPEEMKAVAKTFQGSVMREVSMQAFLKRIPQLRIELGDRSVLRGFHFLQENERVLDQVKALENSDFVTFVDLIKKSGDSSYKYLQNIYAPHYVQEQGVAVALALTEMYIDKIKAGACRVHGGGFSGTILVFLPKKAIRGYFKQMESVFGENCVIELKIRERGTLYLNPFM